MLELIFDRFNKPSQSPILISFLADSPPPIPQPIGIGTAITLNAVNRLIRPVDMRFNEMMVALVSPITLKYTGDIYTSVVSDISILLNADITQTEIIVDRTFGIELGIGWNALNSAQQEMLLVNAASDCELQTAIIYDNDNPTQRNYVLNWRSRFSVGIQSTLAWFSSPVTQAFTHFVWALPQDFQATLAINWQTTKAQWQNVLVAWIHIPAEQLTTEVNWINGAKHEVTYALRYQGHVIDSQPVLAWGYHPARWICSTKYRPPIGKVTFDFDVSREEAELIYHLPQRLH